MSTSEQTSVAHSKSAHQRPTLDENAKAIEFFSNEAFFKDMKCRDFFIQQMREKLEGKTVREVFEGFKNRDEAVAYFTEHTLDVRAYYDQIQWSTTPEKILSGLEIIPLNQYPEVNLAKERYTTLESTQNLLSRVTGKANERELPVFIVLGPSGSGKTFFSIRDAAIHKAQDPKVTLYVCPGYLPEGSGTDPERLINWIKGELKHKHKVELTTKLEMHISLVLDEAGASQFKGYFEQRENLEKICFELAKLATSTRLIICGTGLQGNSLDSEKDIYKFHMKHWHSRNLVAVLRCHFQIPAPETRKLVVAIDQQLALKALSTNARCAYFLLQSVHELHKKRRPEQPISWIDELYSRTPAVVNEVVACYIANNCLSNIREQVDRVRVAAAVLQIIEDGKHAHKVPEPRCLPYRLQHAAKAMVDLNLELKGGKLEYSMPNVPCAVLISPALLIVTCSLLGVSASVLTGWDAQELVTVLHEFRTSVLVIFKCWGEKYDVEMMAVKQRYQISERGNDLQYWDFRLAEEFHGDLEKLTLVRVLKQVPELPAENTFYIPFLGHGKIWINSPAAPFANIVAPYTLFQCKHCTSGTPVAHLDISEALYHCGLLKNQDTNSPGRIVLRGLVYIWGGKFEIDANKHKKRKIDTDMQYNEAQLQLEQDRKQKSVMYPFNLLDTPTCCEETTYAKIEMQDGVWMIQIGSKWEALPELPQDGSFQLTYVISTNADTVVLEYDNDGIFDIGAEQNGQENKETKGVGDNEWMCENSISENSSRTWVGSVGDNLRIEEELPQDMIDGILDGVKIKFLIA